MSKWNNPSNIQKLKYKRIVFPTYIILISIILLGIILRLSYQCGLCNLDSYAYIVGALKINDNGIWNYFLSLSNIHENRISIVFPLALMLKMFGLSEFSITLLPLFYSVGTIVIVYSLGKQLFDNKIALLASLLVATVPLDVFYSTAIIPDSIIPFYVGLTLLCFVVGQKRENRLFFLLSGFFLFCAFQARATSGILIFPLLLIAWWSSKRSIWALILPTFSFLAFIVIYWGILFLITGEFFLQLKLLTQDATVEKYVGTGEFLGYFIDNFRINGNFGFLYLIVFPALLVAIYKMRQEESYRLPVIIFVTLYIFFEFGSTTLTSYQPIWKFNRFLTILSIPASLIIASVTIFALSNSPRWLRLGIFALLTTHIIFSVVFPLYNKGMPQHFIDFNNPYKTTITHLGAYNDIETIHVVHFRWLLRGEFYARLSNRTYQFQDMQNKSTINIEDGDVVIYDPIFFTPLGEYELNRLEYPELYSLPEQVPDNWQLLFTVNRSIHPEFLIYVYLVKA